AIADLNGDGKADLVATYTDPGVSILLGNGDGTFGPAVNYATNYGPQTVAVGDFNLDGRPDLAVGYGGETVTEVTRTTDEIIGYEYPDEGDGWWPIYGWPPPEPQPIYYTYTDWVVESFAGVAFLENNGDGTFGAETDVSAGEGLGPICSLAVGDFDHNG